MSSLLTEPAERGRTTVADRVVERIAGHAADEVPDVRRVPRRLPGLSDTASRASAAIDGRSVQLQLRVAVAYPVDLTATAAAITAHVTERVQRLCDLTVNHVDVRIEALVAETDPGRRVQ